MKAWFARFIDIQAEWLVGWLRSRSAFVWLVYGTILWIPLVVFGIDAHGFLYLYVATSLSLITQVPLAMLAYRAHRDAKHAEELTRQSLQNQTDMLSLLIDAFGERAEVVDEILEDLKEEISLFHPREVSGVLPVVDQELDVEKD